MCYLMFFAAPAVVPRPVSFSSHRVAFPLFHSDFSIVVVTSMPFFYCVDDLLLILFSFCCSLVDSSSFVFLFDCSPSLCLILIFTFTLFVWFRHFFSHESVLIFLCSVIFLDCLCFVFTHFWETFPPIQLKATPARVSPINLIRGLHSNQVFCLSCLVTRWFSPTQVWVRFSSRSPYVSPRCGVFLHEVKSR